MCNVQSLWSKYDELLVFASSIRPDVIALTESWTNSSISDSQISIPGYSSPIRHDRGDERKGGGVCCYVHSSIYCSLLEINEKCPPFIENVWLKLPSVALIIAFFYVPPSLKADQQQAVVSYIVDTVDGISGAHPTCRTIIAGDFNKLPCEAFENLLGLTQIVNEPTRGESVLDKVFLDEDILNDYNAAIVGPNFGRADHKSVFVKPISCKNATSKLVKIHDFRKSNMDKFLVRLAETPWHKMYRSSHDIQMKCDLFYKWFYEAMNKIPCSYVEMKSSDKPWLTPILKQLINLKHEAFRQKQMHLYRHYQKKVQLEIRVAKIRWVENQKESSKKVWNIVRGLTGVTRKQQNDVGSIIAQFSSAFEAAEEINNTFAKSFSGTLPNWNFFEALIMNNDEWDVDTSVESLYYELKQLNSKKSCGSDGIHARLLKEAALILAEPLSHLLSTSISEGRIPFQWKTTNIVPIPKSSNITLDNLRPISLLPTMSKILERRVLASMKPELLKLYGVNQYGFRPQSSTLCALIALLDFVTRTLDRRDMSGVALMSFDMSKAFDRLSHTNLFNSLLCCNLSHKCLRWCANYLQDRSQRVILPDGSTSSFINISSGVPQGAILSPYFFASHMGSLKPASNQTTMIKFADDVVIAVPFLDTQSIERLCEEEFDNMRHWCKHNGLFLNEKKTRIMLIDKTKSGQNFSIAGIQLIHEMKILGVVIQEDLKWDAHINHICKLASRRVYLLKVLKQMPIPACDLVQIYKAYIQSILEYNSPLFVGASKRCCSNLERIRKRCHRIICGFECRCELLPNLSQRREERSLKFFKEILGSNHILHHLAPTILSHTNHASIPYSRTNRRAMSFIPFACLLFNCSL